MVDGRTRVRGERSQALKRSRPQKEEAGRRHCASKSKSKPESGTMRVG